MKRAARPSAPRSSRLFAEPEHPPTHAEGAYRASIDGAARGNPGPASYGAVILRPDGQPLEQLKKYIGRTTNNVAEYYALIAALDYAAAHGIKKLRVRSDSELLVRQMKGLYKVKSADLRPLHERAKKLADGLAYFYIEYVPREQNRIADGLANEALDADAGKRSSLASQTRKAQLETRPLRAIYRRGALHPVEPLDLPEGAEVEITIRKRSGD